MRFIDSVNQCKVVHNDMYATASFDMVRRCGPKCVVLVLDGKMMRTSKALIAAGIPPNNIVVVEHSDDVHMEHSKSMLGVRLIKGDIVDVFKRMRGECIIASVYFDLCGYKAVKEIEECMRTHTSPIVFAITCSARIRKGPTSQKLFLSLRESMALPISFMYERSYMNRGPMRYMQCVLDVSDRPHMHYIDRMNPPYKTKKGYFRRVFWYGFPDSESTIEPCNKRGVLTG
jgi:hypothetical protein